MINIEEYKKIDEYLKSILNEKRYFHSISVAFCAMNLAIYHNINKDDAFLAGILHDIAKCYDDDTMIKKCNEYNIKLTEDDYKSLGVLHSYVGAYEAKKLYNINDDIFNAIYTHTLGDINMSPLQKIIFIADFIEPTREFRENISEVIKYAYIDLDKCVLKEYDMIMEYLKSKNKYINKKTIDIYNELKKKYEK